MLYRRFYANTVTDVHLTSTHFLFSHMHGDDAVGSSLDVHNRSIPTTSNTAYETMKLGR